MIYKLKKYFIIDWYNPANNTKGHFDARFEDKSTAIYFLNNEAIKILEDDNQNVIDMFFKIKKRYRLMYN